MRLPLKRSVLSSNKRHLLKYFAIGGTAAAGLYGVAAQADVYEPSTAPRRLKEHFEGYFNRVRQTGAAANMLLQSLASNVRADRHRGAGGVAAVLTAAVADTTAQHDEREIVVVVGGPLVLDWLLHHAAAEPGSAQQAAAIRALGNLLQESGTASAVLRRPGAVPLLLGVVAGGRQGSEELAAALGWGLRAAHFSNAVPLEDISQTLAMLGSQHGLAARRLAAEVLGLWAETSVVNCGKIALLGGGKVLTGAAADASTATHDRQLQWRVARSMAILARDCPLTQSLSLESWLGELMYMAADAAARSDWELAGLALEAGASCVAAGSDMQGALERSNALPLLDRLSEPPSSPLRPAACSLLAAAAAAGGGAAVPAAERQRWAERLLGWMTAGGGEGAGDALRVKASAALASLCSAPGPAGLHVAATWLGELLVVLSRNVTPYTAFKVLPETRTGVDYSRAAPVVPAFARAVAAELVAASDRVGAYSEPPPDTDTVISPATAAAYPAAAAAVDSVVADTLLCRALEVLCDLVSHDDEKQRWLHSAGVLPLLRRLTLSRAYDVDAELAAEVAEALGDTPQAACVQRQAARLLGMLSADPGVATSMRNTPWYGWLREATASTDCSLRSHAARALLHIRGAAAASRAAGLELGLLGMEETSMLERVAEELRSRVQQLAAPSGGGVRGCQRAGPPLVLRDGVHLFDPLAAHHAVMAQLGAAASSPDAPLLDVVFVHGIRGGPFATWRRDDTGGFWFNSDPALTSTEQCWPTAWLARDVPGCRLLSVEYPAPASGWEGESLPMADTVSVLMDKLRAAGVGRRPTVFVCHSMGGLVVKELLARCMAHDAPPEEAGVVDATCGLVFYSVPHFGSWLADLGWQLRFLGASPAAAVAHLKPGKHLEELNHQLRSRWEAGALQVLSFGEGEPSQLNKYVPRLMIVPMESAYPGFGDYCVLQGCDHINTCKPNGPDDPSYARTAAFLRGRVQEVLQRQRAAEGRGGDSMVAQHATLAEPRAVAAAAAAAAAGSRSAACAL